MSFVSVKIFFLGVPQGSIAGPAIYIYIYIYKIESHLMMCCLKQK